MKPQPALVLHCTSELAAKLGCLSIPMRDGKPIPQEHLRSILVFVGSREEARTDVDRACLPDRWRYWPVLVPADQIGEA